MSFRDLDKALLRVPIPPEIHQEIRRRAFLAHRRTNEITTLLLCQALDMDPAQFGLDPEDARVAEAEAVSTR